MIHGWAKFVDKNTIDVNGETYTADRFLIAVGMKARAVRGGRDSNCCGSMAPK
jgi:pyruvate/2-oxoglutarate dehydrogenase complex dihydrolipoamide dehydrogenase (E3) component